MTQKNQQLYAVILVYRTIKDTMEAARDRNFGVTAKGHQVLKLTIVCNTALSQAFSIFFITILQYSHAT